MIKLKNRVVSCLLVAMYLLVAVTPVDASSVCAGAAAKIRRLIKQADQKKTRFSLNFVNLDDGSTVVSYKSDRLLPPASNMKLLTTAAAVDLLGPGFTYETVIGLYRGNLVVIGGGDPLTGDAVVARRHGTDAEEIFARTVKQLQQRGIKTIRGNLIVDTSIFDDERFHPHWPVKQANNWYVAQIAGVNFADNCVEVHLTPTRPGQPPRWSLVPDTQYVHLENRALTIARGDNTAWVSRELGTNRLTIRSHCRTPLVINTTIDRPGAYFGFVMSEYLSRHGISITGKLMGLTLRGKDGRLPADMDRLLIWRTPIVDVLKRCNTDSLNMAAECLLKTMGAYREVSASGVSRQGSWAGGRRAVTGFLHRLGVKDEQFNLDDGCGLSRENRLTARTLTTVLKYMANGPAAQLYRQSLATGQSGTLGKRKRFAESRYRDCLFAKTGYIAGCRALSGYCRTRRGKWLVFSILTENSNYQTTAVIDKIVKAVIDE